MIKKTITLLFVLLVLAIAVDFGVAFVGQTLFGAPVLVQEDERLYIHPPYKALRPDLSAQIDGPAGEFLIKTNSYGLREGEIEPGRNSEAIRVGLMGHSLLFGWGVGQEQSIAAFLEHRLESSDGLYEVINFAQPEFSSYQGLRQYEAIVHNFHCDVLVLGFGLYDGFEARMSDAEYFSMRNTFQLDDNSGMLNYLAAFSNTAHWLVTTRQAKREVQFKVAMLRQSGLDSWKARVSEDDYYENMKAVIQHQLRAGGKVLLLFANLLNYKREDTLLRLAEEFELPVLNIRAFFDRLGGTDERMLAARLELERADAVPKSGGENTSLFRVYVPEESEIETPVSIVGPDEMLGNGMPNVVMMNDDGRNGDEETLDSVWSLELPVDEENVLIYAFVENGEEGDWGGAHGEWFRDDKNHVVYYRMHSPGFEPPFAWFSPVHYFNKPLYQHLVFEKSPMLPNRLGHQAIAERLGVIIENMNLRAVSKATDSKNSDEAA